MNDVETLVVGAGLIGSSLAMHLSRLGVDGIRVIDFDLEGALSSSELNAGGVRATWGQPINIEMSKISIEYFASVAQEVGYQPCGYLWLKRAETLGAALKARELQNRMGWPVDFWDVAELRRRVPFIDKTDDLAGAVFAPRDGLINPNLLKRHFRSEARRRGVAFDDRTWLANCEYQDGGITLTARRLVGKLDDENRMRILTGHASEELAWQTIQYRAKRVVNCAGPWAGQVARILGYSSPIRALRRQISIFDCRDVDLTPYGMTVDCSGVYFHPEAGNGLAGVATEEQEGFNYAYDGESFFVEHIWPALYERSSKFERLKHLTGWAGIYEVSPDESAIIGQVEQGDAGKSGRVFESHSFSGHGAMHSYAAGLALAELMVKGHYETIDASVLTGRRFEKGRLMPERLVI